MFKKCFIVLSVMALCSFFILTTGCAPEALEKSDVDSQIDDALNGYIKPIAYGYVGFSGNIFNGTTNFDATNNNTGDYTIHVTGVTLSTSNNFAVITPIGTASIFAVWSISGGDLLIRTYNAGGAAANCNYSFILY